MIRYILPGFIALLAFGLSAFFTVPVHFFRQQNAQEMLTRIGELPSAAVRASCLEFHGAAADIFLLKTFTWVGMKIGERADLTRQEWQQLAKIIDRITDLDPRFWDPYLFAEMMLTWQAGMIDEANRLLLKAARANPNDYRPLYFLGFNQFYFRKDAAKAAPYLRQAALKPGAPAFLKGLAARFSLYGRQTLAGIIFLKGLIRQTNDEKTRRYLEKRLKALEIINSLENAVTEYRKLYGRLPEDLSELVSKGLIEEIPQDPYGGRFVILENGRVYATSELIDRNEPKRPAKGLGPGNPRKAKQ